MIMTTSVDSLVLHYHDVVLRKFVSGCYLLCKKKNREYNLCVGFKYVSTWRVVKRYDVGIPYGIS